MNYSYLNNLSLSSKSSHLRILKTVTITNKINYQITLKIKFGPHNVKPIDVIEII